MSSVDQEESRPARAWAWVWLCGAAAPLAACVFASVAWQMWLDGHGDSYSRGDWAAGLPGFVAIAAIVAFSTALVFIFMVRVAERRVPKPLLTWLALGFVAATPIAMATTAFLAVNPFDRVDRSLGYYVAPLIYFYVAGLIGALAAWRVRRGGWRA